MNKCHLIWVLGEETRLSINNVIMHPGRKRGEGEEKKVVAFTLTYSHEGQKAKGSLHFGKRSQMVIAELFCWERFLSKFQPQGCFTETAKPTVQ